jgi:hypothetical protein
MNRVFQQTDDVRMPNDEAVPKLIDDLRIRDMRKRIGSVGIPRSPAYFLTDDVAAKCVPRFWARGWTWNGSKTGSCR